MKYSFAVASILAASAFADVLIADDTGFNKAVTGVDSGSGVDKFKADWGVHSEFGVNADPEDQVGYQMDSSYSYYESTMKVPDLSKNILMENDEFVFTIKVLGQSPNFSDTYDIKLCAIIDGFAREDKISGIATDKEQDFTLSLRTNKSIDVKDVKIVIGGQDSEYWAGSYGAFFKDMKLVFKSDVVNMLTDESNWNVESSTAVAVNDEDGQGKAIVFSYEMDSVSATTYQKDFENINWDVYSLLVFDVNVIGTWPEYNDTWKLKVCGMNGDASAWENTREGTGTDKYENVHFEWDMKTLPTYDRIVVTLSGDDSEYWAGNYGPKFQGMHLYVAPGGGNPSGGAVKNVDLLTDESNWNVDSSTAVAVNDEDGQGKAIVFSYDYDSVKADAFQTNLEGLNIDWDKVTQLNFDVNVIGTWPEYADAWWVEVTGLKGGSQVWSDSQNGTGTQEYVRVHFQWDQKTLGDFDQVTVTLSGDDSEYWAGNYGPKFQGMHLYFSPPSDSTLMLAQAAATETESSSSGGFGYGFLAGFGATAAICGLAAYSLGSRKQSSIEDPFLRV